MWFLYIKSLSCMPIRIIPLHVLQGVCALCLNAMFAGFLSKQNSRINCDVTELFATVRGSGSVTAQAVPGAMARGIKRGMGFFSSAQLGCKDEAWLAVLGIRWHGP
jgi:hypothetical protein